MNCLWEGRSEWCLQPDLFNWCQWTRFSHFIKKSCYFNKFWVISSVHFPQNLFLLICFFVIWMFSYGFIESTYWLWRLLPILPTFHYLTLEISIKNCCYSRNIGSFIMGFFEKLKKLICPLPPHGRSLWRSSAVED